MKVLKWAVPVDDQAHEIGSGPVVLVECQNDNPATVYVWTWENIPYREPKLVRIYATGQDIDPNIVVCHLGSVQCRGLVWHVFQVAE